MRKKGLSSLLIISAVVVIIVGSCMPEKTDYTAQEQQEINDYFTANPTLSFEEKESGLYYLETVVGTGDVAVKHDTAFVIYTGKFLNGQVFDTNVGKDTMIFPVDEGWMIPGFDEAITHMKEGTKAILVIPSKLGYGPGGYYFIPGYTPLLYDVELARLIPGPGVK
jgi:FKBP-type peptidyl-prolyl cis-trans isomerase